MTKTYLITGAGGWVGSTIVETLCKHNIDEVTNLKLFDIKFAKDMKKNIERLAKGEIRTTKQVSLRKFRIDLKQLILVRVKTHISCTCKAEYCHLLYGN